MRAPGPMMIGLRASSQKTWSMGPTALTAPAVCFIRTSESMKVGSTSSAPVAPRGVLLVAAHGHGRQAGPVTGARGRTCRRISSRSFEVMSTVLAIESIVLVIGQIGAGFERASPLRCVGRNNPIELSCKTVLLEQRPEIAHPGLGARVDISSDQRGHQLTLCARSSNAARASASDCPVGSHTNSAGISPMAASPVGRAAGPRGNSKGS